MPLCLKMMYLHWTTSKKERQLEGVLAKVLGSWNNEVRANSGLYWVRGAATKHAYIVRAHSAFTLSVLWGMRSGHPGMLRCVFIHVRKHVVFLWTTVLHLKLGINHSETD